MRASERTEAQFVDAVRGLLDRGQCLLAQDVARSGLQQHPASWRLHHLCALALAQVGALDEARALLDAMPAPPTASRLDAAQAVPAHGALAGGRLSARLDPGHRVDAGPDWMSPAARADEEVWGLRARLDKERWQRSGDPEHLLAARAHYLFAYERSRGTYAGINAASMSWLLGDRASSTRIARQVLDALTATRLDGITEPADAYWSHVTVGEAALLLGMRAQAEAAYAAAVRRAGRHFRLVASSRRQLKLLAAHGLEVPPRILSLLRPPTIVVFAAGGGVRIGTRATAPRGVPMDALREAMDDVVASMQVDIGYSGAAGGADLTFLDALRRSEAELNVVLPFSREDFVDRMVRDAGAEWEALFEDVLHCADSVTYATHERYLGDDTLLEYASRLLCGTSHLRGEQLDTEPVLITLRDGGETADGVDAGGGGDASAGGGGGGVPGLPASSVPTLPDTWPDPRRVRVIDLTSLHEGRSAPSRGATTPRPHARSPGATATGLAAARPAGRVIRAMLFADLMGFSRLRDEHVATFIEFQRLVAEGLGSCVAQTEYLRTFGDGILAVFVDASSTLRYAVTLRDAVRAARARVTLPEPLDARIALHVGPVYLLSDPYTGELTYLGSHVNRAARLEPITVPGHVYATEEFVAYLRADSGRDAADPALLTHVHWEYLGVLQLAKNFDTQRTYRLSEPVPVRTAA